MAALSRNRKAESKVQRRKYSKVCGGGGGGDRK